MNTTTTLTTTETEIEMRATQEMTMNTYQIRTNDLDMDFGTYQGETPEAALDAMARDVGYTSYAEACATGEMSANCRAVLVDTLPVKRAR